MTMPNGVVVFEQDTVRGLEGGGHSLNIHANGTLEYDSPAAEYSLGLPQAMADDLYAAFAGLAGNPLADGIEAGEEEVAAANPAVEAADEDPQGGRKRRSRGARGSRVKKQTRRAQRKRRNTKRR